MSDADRDTQIVKVIALAQLYYEQGNPTGGNLHIVLDDGNVATEHVEYCREQARAEHDHIGVALAELLLELTEEERELVYETTPAKTMRDSFAAIVRDWILIDNQDTLTAKIEAATAWAARYGPLLPHEKATLKQMIRHRWPNGGWSGTGWPTE